VVKTERWSTVDTQANRSFNALIQSLPTRTIVIGHTAEGTSITIEAHSMFGNTK